MDQWTGAETFFAAMPTWLPPSDARRISAYLLYEEMYWNTSEAFTIVSRGDTQNPVYVPTAMALIEATNRYLCREWTYSVGTSGTDSDRELLSAALDKFFKREKVQAKFAEQKRNVLVRGDAIWHIIADPTKPAGARLSLVTVDPGMYFPIYSYDEDKRIGCHIVEQWEQERGETLIKRQTYRRTPEGRVTYELRWFKISGWDDRTQKLEEVSPPKGELAIHDFVFPERITQLPVYHVKNGTTSQQFGDSEIRGVERAIASISQATSDTELSLALEGLGLYVTTSGPPVDDEGNETEWQLGPGFVAEIDPDADWQRVQGVTTVEPATTYVDFIERKIMAAKGVPEIALGAVDVQTAESGISLQLKMDPLLAKNSEKELEILSVTDQMLYDLVTMWFPEYEDQSFGEALAVSTVGNPLPQNRKAVLDEIVQLVAAKIISLETARKLVNERLGYEIPDSTGNDIVMETLAMDPFAARVDAEIGNSA